MSTKMVSESASISPRPSRKIKMQSTPGVLTLSKPVESDSKVSKTGGKKRRQIDRENITRAADVTKEDDVTPLSASAKEDREDWALPSSSSDVETGQRTQEYSSALTWQQQQLLTSKLASQSKKKGNKRDKDKHTLGNGSSQALQQQRKNELPSGSNKTWQQIQLEEEKSRATHNDVFADARDLQTFGEAEYGAGKSSKGKKPARISERQRADSMGEISARNTHHLSKKQQSFASVTLAPSTPDKIAYAGPNFHNSPSPASLPVPKFLQSKPFIASTGADIQVHPHQSSPLARHATAMDVGVDVRDAAQVLPHISASSSQSSGDIDRSFSYGLQPISAHARNEAIAPYVAESVHPAGLGGKNAEEPITIESLLSKMRMGGS